MLKIFENKMSVLGICNNLHLLIIIYTFILAIPFFISFFAIILKFSFSPPKLCRTSCDIISQTSLHPSSHLFVVLWLLESALLNIILLFSFPGLLLCSPMYRKQFIKPSLPTEIQTLCQTEVFYIWTFYKRNKNENS